MTCYHPLPAFRITHPDGSVTMKVYSSYFNLSEDRDDVILGNKKTSWTDFNGDFYERLEVGCGQCIGCRLAHSVEWAVRIVNEASLYEKNSFLTLTFDDAYLPVDGSVHKRDLQLFFKRLRKCIYPAQVRYYAAAEYGTLYSRPHYHICLFDYWPDDAKLWKLRGKTKLYVSPVLARLWPFGFHTLGELNFDSAAYVARYCTKKITGSLAEYYYDGLEKEFSLMSTKPGIGSEWLKKFYPDVYGYDEFVKRKDYIVIRDKFKLRPPRYYDKIYERDLNGDLQYLKNMRSEKASAAKTLTNDLLYKEKVKELTLKQRLKRHFENGD